MNAIEVKRHAGLSSVERALMIAKEERERFKTIYKQWREFYEVKVLAHPTTTTKEKAKQWTKPQPFMFLLDQRRRGGSVDPGPLVFKANLKPESS